MVKVPVEKVSMKWNENRLEVSLSHSVVKRNWDCANCTNSEYWIISPDIWRLLQSNKWRFHSSLVAVRFVATPLVYIEVSHYAIVYY